MGWAPVGSGHCTAGHLWDLTCMGWAPGHCMDWAPVGSGHTVCMGWAPVGLDTVWAEYL